MLSRFTITNNQRQMIINKLKSKNMLPIFDYVLENVNGDNQKYVSTIKNHLIEFPEYPIAIKLSSFGKTFLYKDFFDIYNNSQSVVYVDAEQLYINDKQFVNMCFTRNIKFAKTYQMYIKNEIKTLENDIKLYGNSAEYKLVRGAYWNEEKDTGFLYTNKNDVDNQYNNAIDLTKHLDTVLYATHNEKSLSLVPNGKKVAQLLGMSDNLSESLTKTHTVFKYVPFGNLHESIPYLIRRLYENFDIRQHMFK